MTEVQPTYEKANGHSAAGPCANGRDPAAASSDPCIYPVGNYRVMRLDPLDTYSSKFLYAFVIRCLQFVEKYGSETPQPYIVNKIYELFTPERRSLIHMLVALDAEEQIRAHSLAFVDLGGKLGWIVQLLQVENETGDPRIPVFGLRLIEEWTRDLKLKTILATTLSESVARYDKKQGFAFFRAVMRKDV